MPTRIVFGDGHSVDVVADIQAVGSLMDVRGPAPALVKYELTESRDGLVEIYVNPAMVAYIAWLPPLA